MNELVKVNPITLGQYHSLRYKGIFSTHSRQNLNQVPNTVDQHHEQFMFNADQHYEQFMFNAVSDTSDLSFMDIFHGSLERHEE